jgi:NAD(P)-dependent dehydrogenase (short-subunit alcohol dehydrogenase family)
MKVALITGASRGLGAALARTLAQRGWALVLDARNADALDAVVSELGAAPAVEAVAGDVTDPAHRAALVAAAERFGRLDLLVNNASTLGASPQPRLEDWSLDGVRAVYETNVVAPLALVQATLPLLRASEGAVVDVTSDAAVEGYEGWGAYGSSKAALEQLSRVLAAEEPGVRVWWVDPGDMRTQMHQEAFPGEDISDRPPPEASVPGLVRLVEERPASGRYVARELVGVGS